MVREGASTTFSTNSSMKFDGFPTYQKSDTAEGSSPEYGMMYKNIKKTSFFLGGEGGGKAGRTCCPSDCRTAVHISTIL